MTVNTSALKNLLCVTEFLFSKFLLAGCIQINKIAHKQGNSKALRPGLQISKQLPSSPIQFTKQKTVNPD